MRNMIGKEIDIYVLDEGQVVGKILFDDKSFVHIKMEDGKTKRIVKSKICSMMLNNPEDETLDYVPFHVLFCENKSKGCAGVQFIQEGEGFKKSDFDKFTSECPCRGECSFGTKGELRGVSGSYLRNMFGNTMFGSYPEKKEKKEEKENGGSTGTNGEAERRSEEG